MIRRSLLAVCLVLLSSLQALAAFPYDSVCAVVINGRIGGSGTLIAVNEDKAVILTCRHVAMRVGNKAECTFLNGVTVSGRVHAIHPDRLADMALLVMDRPEGVEPVPMAVASEGTAPFVLTGYPSYSRDKLRWQLGDFYSVSKSELIVTCRPEKGMSGGAAFDRYGRVIGVVAAYGPNYGVVGGGTEWINWVEKYIE
jgi:hypothetical protein